jgi:multicomponent K+:H+ antiporter subunit A
MLPTLALIIGVPFLVAALVLLLPRSWSGRLALVAPAVVLLLAVPLWPEFGGDAVHLERVEWFPTLNMTADLRVDRLGLFFVLLIGGIGLGIVQYGRYYLGKQESPQFWAALLAFMGAMLGIVLSDSLILLFVFWELTTITSALLIGMDFGKGEARRGAIQAFLVTGLGGLALLAGVVLLGQMAGTYNLSELAAQSDAIVGNPWHLAPLILLFLGAFTKSAQFPFHFWLPGAMAAPAPVSAYLHSATMVKAGVFLLGRLFPIFHESQYWLPTLAAVGLTTFLVAGWNAVKAYDLKQLLAHSTVAYLGVLTALYGFYSVVGLRGEVVNIMNHALYKSSLFLLIGWVEKRMGTRDLELLQRERWIGHEKLAAVLIGVGAFAMAGLPFLLGFMAKDVFFQAVIGGPTVEEITLYLGLTLLASTLATIYALKVWAGTFLGSEPPVLDRGYPPKKISPWLLIVPGVLLLPQVVGGVFPAWFLGTVVEPGTTWSPWAIWYYIDVKVALSLGIIVFGVVGYLYWRRLAALPSLPGPQQVSDGLADGALGFSSWMSRAVQAGGHPRYFVVTLLFAVAMVAVGLRWGGWSVDTAAWAVGPELSFGWLPALLITGGAFLTILLPGRIAKVVVVALVGYGMAVVYVLYRAPDLALTQLLVETISLVLLLLIFRRMPRLTRDPRSLPTRWVHGIASAVVGVTMGMLAWTIGSTAAPNPAGYEQLALSYPVAQGQNVVNVILVDFRGIDTFGEVVVLVIAALGALALFRVASTRKEAAPAAPKRTEKLVGNKR